MKDNTVTTDTTSSKVAIKQLYQHSSGDIYAVAQVAREAFAMISLASGERYTNPKSDINEVFGNFRSDFTRVYNSTITAA